MTVFNDGALLRSSGTHRIEEAFSETKQFSMLLINNHHDVALAEFAFDTDDAWCHDVSALANIRNRSHVNYYFRHFFQDLCEKQCWENGFSSLKQQRLTVD